MKTIADILDASSKSNRYHFDPRLAIVEFTVCYLKAGEFVSYDDIQNWLWEGKEQWDDREFSPLGLHVANYYNGIVSYKDGKAEKVLQDGVFLSKDEIVIIDHHVVSNVIGGESALDVELDNIGIEIFNEYTEEIMQIAKSLPKPLEREVQYSTFLTLWKVVYDEYSSWDSMYPEYDMWAECYGLLRLEDILKGLGDHK
jgi:hypothetical protein